jgi:hypothetical protein
MIVKCCLFLANYYSGSPKSNFLALHWRERMKVRVAN